MRYLIDTCVFAEYARPLPQKEVIDGLDALPQENSYVSVITIGEIQKGITRMPSSRRKHALGVFLTDLIERFDEKVLGLTTPTMLRWGRLTADLERVGRTLPVIDSLLAATALEHDLTIVTRNIRDFTPAGVKVLDLWA
jgi:predicted nucleic acid-binding protein